VVTLIVLVLLLLLLGGGGLLASGLHILWLLLVIGLILCGCSASSSGPPKAVAAGTTGKRFGGCLAPVLKQRAPFPFFLVVTVAPHVPCQPPLDAEVARLRFPREEALGPAGQARHL
jgi:hypothetical protein